MTTQLRDEALDQLTGDVVLDADGGDQTMVYDLDGIASDLKSAWSQIKGEWFLDLNEGVDWIGKVFAKQPNLGDVANEFIRVGRAVPGVTDLQFTALSVDRAARTLNANWQATMDTGQVLSEQDAVLTPGGP